MGSFRKLFNTFFLYITVNLWKILFVVKKLHLFIVLNAEIYKAYQLWCAYLVPALPNLDMPV